MNDKLLDPILERLEELDLEKPIDLMTPEELKEQQKLLEDLVQFIDIAIVDNPNELILQYLKYEVQTHITLIQTKFICNTLFSILERNRSL